MTTPSFDFSDALGAPFVQIRRRPLTIFAWGLMLTAMIGVIYALMIPILLDLPLNPDQPEVAAQTYSAEVARIQVALNGANLLLYGMMLLIWTATGRATLSAAHRDKFLFLRLGMDEVRVAVVAVSLFLGWYIGVVILTVAGMLLGVGLWRLSQRAAIGVGIVYGLAVCAVAIWSWCRISLMIPASLILKRFAFVEGWVLARGQVWKLVGLNLVVWLLYILVYLVILAVMGAILFGAFMGQGLRWPEVVDTPADLLPLVSPMTVPALIAAIPFAFGYGALVVLWSSPSVQATQQLLERSPASATREGTGVSPSTPFA